MSRDALLEGEWFEQLRKEAAALGIPAEPVIRRCHARLVIGADRYGDSDFETKRILDEARDEAVDLVNYALLETHKRNAAGGGGHHHLMRAALYAVMADRELQLSRSS